MEFGRDLSEKLKQHIKSSLPAEHEPRWKRILVRAVLVLLGITLTGMLAFTVLIGVLSIGLPDVRDFDKLAGTESTIIYDRDGGTFYTIQGEANRKYVPLDQISPYLQKATLAIEDDKFYEHSGFDVSGIANAVLYEVFGIGTRRGGSTITQQLAKNAFLSPERAYTRKIKELILAVRLERTYDKNKILEFYLNRIPYGNNAYGAELASKFYFKTTAKDLTLGESAILAALPKAPTFYSPYGNNEFSKLDREFTSEELKQHAPKSIVDLDEKDYTIGLVGHDIALSTTQHLYLPGRADIVLKRMQDLGMITEEEKNAAIKETQHLEFQKYQDNIRAAHFVFYIQSQLEDQFGKDVVAHGGLRVYTTLDPKLEDAAQKAVGDQIKYSKEAHGVSNGALYSINPKTGELLAMIGSADYFDVAAHGNVNHVFAKRQPGSSFKPIVYAKAFLNRYAPATVLYDTPTNFGSGYKPKDFEGLFKGPMSIRQALGQSRNIPALKAYFLAGQQEEIINLANKMGITTLDPKGDYGPPLAIGAGEVRLADMVQAFSVFANNGVKRPIYSIMKVTDRDGNVLYEHKPEESVEETVLDPQVAFLINNILSDKSVYLGQYLDVPGHTTAAKTGTSNKEITPVKILPSNLWALGYTPSIVTGVWAGNSDGSPTKNNADGYNVAAPIWSKFMSAALKDQPDEAFPVPDGIKWVTISKATGLLPSIATPDYAKVSAPFASFSVPTTFDDIYRQVEVNDKDNLLPNEFTPAEYIKKKVFMNHHDPILDYPSWLAGIHDWVTRKHTDDPSFPNFPPTEQTKMFTLETAQNKPTVSIANLTPGMTVNSSTIQIETNVTALNGVLKVAFYLDDRSIPNSTQSRAPYTGTIRLTGASAVGQHTITVKVYDKIGYIGETKLQLNYQP